MEEIIEPSNPPINSPEQKPKRQKIAPSVVMTLPNPISSSRRSDVSSVPSPFPISRPTKFNWVWARNFVISIQTRYMQDVLKDDNMPDFSTINHWMERYPKFSQWVKRSRTMFADYLAERSASMFDDPAPMEKMATKNGVFERISMSGVQRERYKSQAMFNLAAKFNPDTYGDKLNVHNSFDLSAVLTTINGPKTAKRLKQASKVIEAQAENKPTT